MRLLLAVVQSAKAALAAAVENTEGVREAVAAKEVLEAAQKSSTAAWRAHSVSPTHLFHHLCSKRCTVAWHQQTPKYPASSAPCD